MLIAALLFSTGGVVIKATSLSGLQVSGTRSLIAALVLWLLIPSWRVFWKPRQLMVGACYAGALTCFVIANKFTLAANAIFLQATSPIYILLLAPRLLGEQNRTSDYALTAALALGMALFFVGDDPASATAPNPALGNAFAIAAGAFVAFGLMGLRRLARDPDEGNQDQAGGAIVASNVMAALLCLPFALPWPTPTWLDIASLGYLGVIQIGLAYFLLTRGLRGLPAVEVSLLLLLEPLLNTLLAWGVYGEAPAHASLAGCAVIGLASGLRLAVRDRS